MSLPASDPAAGAIALKFQVGARTLAAIPRELVRVPVDLDGAIDGDLPVLAPLPSGAHGYLVTSLAEARHADLVRAAAGMLVHVRQRYTRHHADLTIGFDAFMARLSGNARSQLKRKARRIADASGGVLAVERFVAPEEMERFHTVARGVAARTYQEKLMGGGLPADNGFVQSMLTAAAADRARGWLLRVGGEPAAYLYGAATGARGAVLRYDYVGHDPAFNDLSPGSVLMLEAFRDLMTEGRFQRFDFTEGEGQHKRQFATGGTACLDLLLLRPTMSNRAAIAALGGFDRMVATAKDAATHPALQGLAKKVRRAA